MCQEIIVDTSALIAFFVNSETHHQVAQRYCLNNPQNRWIILESVFDETDESLDSSESPRVLPYTIVIEPERGLTRLYVDHDTRHCLG